MRRRAGFTILELMIALSLASIVVGTIVGMYSLMGHATRTESERFEDAASEVMSQETLRRAFTDLVAAAPMLPAEAASAEATQEEGAERLSTGERGESVTTGRRSLSASPGVGTPVMFDLAWNEYESGLVAQRLEIVTLRAPVPYDLVDPEELRLPVSDRELARWQNPERVRSVFEFVFNEEAQRWDLAWRAIDPPGRPVTVARDLVFGQWSVLKASTADSAGEARRTEGWADVASAFLGEDFPIAVRLEYETREGDLVDWLFETLVVTRGY